MEKDERKTRLLTELGWTVIRVREAIPAVGEHDVVVPLLSSEQVRAKATLEKLHGLGFTASRYDRYLAAETPWATREADAEVKRPIGRSLATELPELASEWDTIKNHPLTAADVTVGSGRKVCWLCPECNHSWAAVVGSRARGGHGCPRCARSRRTGKRGAPPCRRRPNLQRLYRSSYIDAPVATLILRAIKLAKAMNPKNSPVSARRRASLLRPSASIASIRLAFASASAPRSIKVSM
jgi:Probable Zinc-ribbon domain